MRDSNDLGNVPALRGRRICFSGAYERYRYKEMCVLLQLIVKGGGKLTRKVRDCNTYISCHRVKKPDGRNAYCPRKKAVDELIAQGRKIQSVPFRALLGWLGIDEAELDRLAFPEKYNITEAEADFSEAKGLEIEPAEA